ncbi:MAG: hypothetical protein ABSG96_20635 [Terracidiphilus sp.]
MSWLRSNRHKSNYQAKRLLAFPAEPELFTELNPPKLAWNPWPLRAVSLFDMEQRYRWPWVEAQVEQSIGRWELCALSSIPPSVRYSSKEQQVHEKAYDEGLRAVEREARRAPRNAADRLQAQQRVVALFSRFASIALDLKGEEVDLITGKFLPIGTELARWARSFDRTLTNADTIQACRNAWTCCGLQALLGQPMELTPSILAYSLLYPYSDNYLDQPGLSTEKKLQFSERFCQRLCGESLLPSDPREAAIWTMVQLIEQQYSRLRHPQIFDCLLAIHQAQEQSIAQLGNRDRARNSGHGSLDNAKLLRISCAKGGASVLADACLAQPWLSPEEAGFAFDWGVLLQLGDDLQDVREDLERGSVTLFTRAIAKGEPLDALILQLLHFSRQVADRMVPMPCSTSGLKNLLRVSWRSLILMAVADVQSFCSPQFLAGLEPSSSFRFNFLRTRNQNLTVRHALHDVLFDAFVEAGPGDRSRLPLLRNCSFEPGVQPDAAGELRALSNSLT